MLPLGKFSFDPNFIFFSPIHIVDLVFLMNFFRLSGYPFSIASGAKLSFSSVNNLLCIRSHGGLRDTHQRIELG